VVETGRKLGVEPFESARIGRFTLLLARCRGGSEICGKEVGKDGQLQMASSSHQEKDRVNTLLKAGRAKHGGMKGKGRRMENPREGTAF